MIFIYDTEELSKNFLEIIANNQQHMIVTDAQVTFHGDGYDRRPKAVMSICTYDIDTMKLIESVFRSSDVTSAVLVHEGQ